MRQRTYYDNILMQIINNHINCNSHSPESIPLLSNDSFSIHHHRVYPGNLLGFIIGKIQLRKHYQTID